ncbi:MAG: M1 family metallopeptidase [FCB group bacterium]|nr:M1 family metallopeptidase [FCB group bacterium]
MKRVVRILVLGLVAGWLPLHASQSTGYWQQRFDYRMDVKLIPEDHRIIVHSVINYVNQSPDTLDRVYLHLYPRAFQENSVKYREFRHALGRQSRAGGFLNDIEPYKWDLQIQSFQVTGSDQTQSEDYSIDDTILKTMLPGPLAPGDSVMLDINWTLVVGKLFERAGELNGQFNMAQWYPKLVVYDQEGWHPDVFHAEGEFYGEYGNFDVTLDVPTNYIVGATGVVTEGDPGWDSVAVDTSQKLEQWLETFKSPEADSTRRRIVRFQARQVHDFAWVASPDFLYESGEWNGIKVHVLYDKRDTTWSKVVVERAEEALRWLSTQFGMYPWPQMTVVDRRRGGGMEYPMLVMNGRENEGLIVHEIGHNWFYGILGNNEVDQAWLDEGFTTFQTRWHAMTRYPGGLDPNRSWVKPFQQKHWRFTSAYDNDQWRAIRAQLSGFDEPVQRKAYLYKSGANYSVNAYTKPSLMLHELKAILGDSLFLAAMQHYYSTWKLKHVTEYRFRQAMEETSGRELDWFFDAWLHDTRIADFALTGMKSSADADGGWHTTVTVEQKGNRLLPPVVDLVFKDGSTQRLNTDDFLWRYYIDLTADTKAKPVRAIVDPDNEFLDVDRRNNMSGKFPTEFMFRWPGMYYQPRNANLVTWSPLLYYQDVDGAMPGVSLRKSYGPWESTEARIVFSPETGRIFYDLSGWRKPTHHPQGNRWFSFHAFDFGGAEGVKVQVTRQMSRGYGMNPVMTVRHGIYTVNAKDLSRTDIFDRGRSTVFFTQGFIDMNRRSITVDIQAAPRGWSDWSFGRVALTTKFSKDIKSFQWKNRIFAGKIWSVDTIPVQERFGIEGNGSYDLYAHSYTRDASSLYGLANLRSYYHLEGDGNLRGFVGRYSGTEAIITWNSELSAEKTVLGIDLTGSAFTDLGLASGSKFTAGDRGFSNDVLGDAGLGLEIRKNIWGQRLYLRMDLPFMTFTPDSNGPEIDFQRWLFSFQTAF